MASQVQVTLPGYVANAVDASQLSDSVILELTQTVDKRAVAAISRALEGLTTPEINMEREVYDTRPAGSTKLPRTLAEYRQLRRHYAMKLRDLENAITSSEVQAFLADAAPQN